MGTSFYRSLFFRFFVAVVVIQGIHVVEHIIQLGQIYLFNVPENEALGILGYLIQFNDTEEWLHLAFNSTYLLAIYILFLPIRSLTPAIVPAWAFALFVAGAVGLESWHVIEHVVIISNVIQNHGCPCPGIGDSVLGVSDAVLHFVYNSVAYLSLVVPFHYIVQAVPRAQDLVSARPQGTASA